MTNKRTNDENLSERIVGRERERELRERERRDNHRLKVKLNTPSNSNQLINCIDNLCQKSKAGNSVKQRPYFFFLVCVGSHRVTMRLVLRKNWFYTYYSDKIILQMCNLVTRDHARYLFYG